MIDWREIDTFDGRDEPVLLCSNVEKNHDGHYRSTVAYWLYGPDRKSEIWSNGKGTGQFQVMHPGEGRNWMLMEEGDYSQGNESMFDPTHWAPMNFPERDA